MGRFLGSHTVVEDADGHLHPAHDGRERDADAALAHLRQGYGGCAARGAFGALSVAQRVGMRRARGFGVFALAQDVDVLGEVAAVVQGVEGQVEVAVYNERGVIGRDREPFGLIR